MNILHNGTLYDRMYHNGVLYTDRYKDGIVFSGGEEPEDANYQAIIQFATANGYQLPTNQHLNAYQELIVTLKEANVFSKLDLLYVFANNGDNNFRTINLINPSVYKATLFGGVIRTNNGFEGNNVDGYIDTGFNPVQFVGRYQQNDAHRGSFLYKSASGQSFPPIDGILSSNTSNSSSNALFNAQRINQGSDNLDSTLSFSGIGLKLLSRYTNTNIILPSIRSMI